MNLTSDWIAPQFSPTPMLGNSSDQSIHLSMVLIPETRGDDRFCLRKSWPKPPEGPISFHNEVNNETRRVYLYFPSGD